MCLDVDRAREKRGRGDALEKQRRKEGALLGETKRRERRARLVFE